jgi:hypothetical protein
LLALFVKSLKIGLFPKAAASCRTPKAPSGRKNYAALAEDGGAPATRAKAIDEF